MPETSDFLFKLKKPNNLWAADKPPALGGIPKQVSVPEIEKQHNFTYTDDIIIPQSLSSVNTGHSDGLEFIWKKVIERLQNPLTNSLILCFIDSTVGYGVFAKKFIKAGTIIGVYSGLLEEKHYRDDYGQAITGLPYRINAHQFGGITRFIQHLPYSHENISKAIMNKASNGKELLEILDGNGIFFDDKDNKDILKLPKNSSKLTSIAQAQIMAIKQRTEAIRNEITTKPFLNKIVSLATQNLQTYPLQYEGKTIVYIQAICDIQPNEQLGFSYGLNYWNNKGVTPRYFDKQGKIVSQKVYLPTLNSILYKYKAPKDSIHLPDKETALRRAATTKPENVNSVAILLEYGALINEQDKDNSSKKTALHWAVKQKNNKIEELLILRGASDDIRDANGKKPSEYQEQAPNLTAATGLKMRT